MKLPRHKFPGVVPGVFRKGFRTGDLGLLRIDVELTHNLRQYRGGVTQRPGLTGVR